MTKEQIREKIAEILLKNDGNSKLTYGGLADSIFSLTYPNGQPMIAVLDEDQSLPSFARVDIARKPEVGRWYDGYKVGQQDMRKERFRRVKSNE